MNSTNLPRIIQGFAAWVVIVAVLPSFAFADLFVLSPTGNGGDGLLGSNIDPAPTNPGSGGLGPTGITLDSVTQTLTIDIQWGSANGFEDLTGNVAMLHLHGPTPSDAPNSFDERGPLMINLGNSLNFDPSGTGGSLTESFFVSNQEIEWILAGRTYINVHTDANLQFGEIRGYLIVVPEPASGAIILPLLLGMLKRNRRYSNS